MKKIKVLIVDDSALTRKILREILSSDPEIEVVDAAHDPIFAVQKIKKYDPDLITLDVEMPRMDGLTFLQKLMRNHPIPTLMISSLTSKNADITLKALMYGAFDFIEKPQEMFSINDLKDKIIEKVKAGASKIVRQKLTNIYQNAQILNTDNRAITEIIKRPITRMISTTEKIIAIGASTGGTTAINTLLAGFPVETPGIVIVQHMPEAFTKAFADRLNSLLPLHIKEARDGEEIRRGMVFIAPGNKHMEIYSSGAKYYTKIHQNQPVNLHRPSVEVLFDSVAKFAGKNAIGVMLTGMGEDGSRAMKRMKDEGSYNFVQDEPSSIVWGMPGKAAEYGAADKILPLDKIASGIISFINNG